LAETSLFFDNWFSSMPGPTWPNRLFAHAGSSAGLDNSLGNLATIGAVTQPGQYLRFDHLHIFEQLVAKVVGFVDAPAQGLDLPLDIRGTAFQRRVWDAIRGIPAGSTASYAEIARRIGAPKAVRSVAQACASNALAVAIPCHRVVRTDGQLSGYRWGVARKRALLAREARA
jgi:O-6-methylguanine DNA methyltransferase